MNGKPRACGGIESIVYVAVLSATVAAPMLWLHRDSIRNLISFHGTLHAALGQRFFDGSVPPENPFFAGKSVRYYWFYHAVGYLVARMGNVSVVYAFEFIAVVSVAAVAIGAVALGRRAYGAASVGAVMFLLVMAGANPLGWLILLAKIARDGTRIMSGPADAVVSPMLQQVQFDDHRFGPNFTFFMHMTSRAASIALLVLALWLLWEWMRGGRKLAMVLLPPTVALMVAMSPVLGLAAVAALALSLVALHVWEHGGGRWFAGAIAPPRMIYGAALLVLGAVLALPTMLTILSQKSNVPMTRIDPTRLKLCGIIAVNGFPVLVLAVLGMRAGGGAARGFARVLVFAGVILFGWSAVLAMPGTIPPHGVIGNEHNLFNAAIVLLAVPASGWIVGNAVPGAHARSKARKRRALWMTALFVPTPLLILTAYTGRANVPVRCAPDRLVWTRADDPVARLYEWVLDHTARNAVFVTDPDAKPDRLCNVSDFPAFTNRSLWTDFSTYMTEAYPEEAFRLYGSRALARGEAASEEVQQSLKALGRPIYILTYQADDAELIACLKNLHDAAVFDAPPIAVFSWSES